MWILLQRQDLDRQIKEPDVDQKSEEKFKFTVFILIFCQLHHHKPEEIVVEVLMFNIPILFPYPSLCLLISCNILVLPVRVRQFCKKNWNQKPSQSNWNNQHNQVFWSTGAINSVKRNVVLAQKVCDCICNHLVALISWSKWCSSGKHARDWRLWRDLEICHTNAVLSGNRRTSVTLFQIDGGVLDWMFFSEDARAGSMYCFPCSWWPVSKLDRQHRLSPLLWFWKNSILHFFLTLQIRMTTTAHVASASMCWQINWRKQWIGFSVILASWLFDIKKTHGTNLYKQPILSG